MNRIGLHGFVSGKVQGVGFREATRREAERLGVQGWVRNCEDGRVEVWLEGQEPEVARLADWLTQGPPAAEVEEARLAPCQPEGMAGFGVRR